MTLKGLTVLHFLRRPSRQNGSKYPIFLLAKSYLQGLVDHMSKYYEPASTRTTPKGRGKHVLKVFIGSLCHSFDRFFLSFQFFSENRSIKKNRTQSDFMLRRWLAHQYIAESIRNRSSALDFSFPALLLCKMDLKSNKCRKKRISDFSNKKSLWKTIRN